MPGPRAWVIQVVLEFAPVLWGSATPSPNATKSSTIATELSSQAWKLPKACASVWASRRRLNRLA